MPGLLQYIVGQYLWSVLQYEKDVSLHFAAAGLGSQVHYQALHGGIAINVLTTINAQQFRVVA